MEKDAFEQLILESIAALPEQIREKLNNVEFVLEEGESPGNSLFGLYHGVSQLNRGPFYSALPDKITIYKSTIEQLAGGEDKVPSLVRRVVWHEIGHHFGFNEEQVRALEAKWVKEHKLD